MESIYELTLLFDFYGPLLTEKQQRVISLHLSEDLSLGEIALELDCSRQAVADSIKKAKTALYEYEAKLGLVDRHMKAIEELEKLEKKFPDKSEEIEKLKDFIV